MRFEGIELINIDELCCKCAKNKKSDIVKTDRLKFELNANGDKVCSACEEVIEKKYTSCFGLEWCPYCGCNIKYLEAVGILK